MNFLDFVFKHTKVSYTPDMTVLISHSSRNEGVVGLGSSNSSSWDGQVAGAQVEAVTFLCPFFNPLETLAGLGV